MEELIDSVKEYLNTHKSMSDASRATMMMEADRAAGLRARLFDVMEEAKKNYEANAVAEDAPEGKTSNSLKVVDIAAEYKNAIDDKLLGYIKRALSGPTKPYEVVEKRVNNRLKNDISDLISIDVSDYKNVIYSDEVKHIWNDHGKNGKTDDSMSDIKDLARIAYVIKNYDRIKKATGNDNKSTKYRNRDNTPSDKIILQKKIGDNYYYVVEAVPDSEKKSVKIISAYINKKDTFDEESGASRPTTNVRNDLQHIVSSSDSSIAPESEKSTTSFSLKTPVEESGDLIAVHNINKQE